MRVTAKVFQDGNNQAISLPKECRVDSEEVYIEKIGNSLVIIPKEKNKWEIMKEALSDLEEFERNQPKIQERELF